MCDGNEGYPRWAARATTGEGLGIIARPLPESIRQSRAMLPRFAGFAEGIFPGIDRVRPLGSGANEWPAEQRLIRDGC
jgi:hypothetical protein